MSPLPKLCPLTSPTASSKPAGPNRPYRRATTLTRSDHPTATGESAPSVTLTPKSPHAHVRYEEAPPVLQSPGDRYDDTRELPLGSTSASHPQRSHSKRAARSRPPRARSGHESRIVTNRHATSRFYDFGQPFPSQGGPPDRAKLRADATIFPKTLAHFPGSATDRGAFEYTPDRSGWADMWLKCTTERPISGLSWFHIARFLKIVFGRTQARFA